MKYAQGNLGRVFIARIEHGDDLLDELKNLARRETIEAAVFYVIGAIKEASMVVGPQSCTRSPVPVRRSFNDCREILGIGTIFPDSGEPSFHLHGSIGRGDTVLTGCVRDKSEVYLVCEAIILEITGSGASRQFDEPAGLKMLEFLSGYTK